jgi:opacity protein-like surface antigen
MIKTIAGIALFSLPFSSFAEISVVSEILIGQSTYDINSTLRTEIRTEVSEKNYSSSLNSDSFGFRLGIKFTDNFSFELAKHEHGKSVNYVTVYILRAIPPSPNGGSCCLGPDEDSSLVAIVPIDLESIRLGIKGEMELFENTSINARLGLARWKYGEYTPQKLSDISGHSNSGETGNDIYYSLGAEYKFTENFHIGVEYSLLKISVNKTYDDEYSGSYNNNVKDLSFVIGWAF